MKKITLITTLFFAFATINITNAQTASVSSQIVMPTLKNAFLDGGIKKESLYSPAGLKSLSQRASNMLFRGGLIMAGAGVIVIGVGAALIDEAGGETHYNYSNYNGQVEESGDPKGGLGAVMVGGGVLLIAGGVTMAIIGHKQGGRLSMNVSPNSVTFAYNF